MPMARRCRWGRGRRVAPVVVRHARRPLIAAAVTALLALAQGAGPASAGVSSGSTRFTGPVTGATGHFRHLRAQVRITLTARFAPVPSGSPPAGTFSADVAGTRCTVPRRCLTGRLTGTWSTRRTLPDVGSSVKLSGRGRLTGVGEVAMSAIGQGPGNIAVGHPTLEVRLRAKDGVVRLATKAPAVPGFTPFF